MTNEKFIELLRVYDSKIDILCRTFSKIDSYDELKQLAYIALWQAYEKYDSNKCIFSTYVHKMIVWFFLKHHRRKKKTERLYDVADIKRYSKIEFTDSLTEYEQKIFDDRFIMRYTLKELCQKYSVKQNQVLKIIEKIKSKLQKDMT